MCNSENAALEGAIQTAKQSGQWSSEQNEKSQPSKVKRKTRGNSS